MFSQVMSTFPDENFLFLWFYIRTSPKNCLASVLKKIHCMGGGARWDVTATCLTVTMVMWLAVKPVRRGAERRQGSRGAGCDNGGLFSNWGLGSFREQRNQGQDHKIKPCPNSHTSVCALQRGSTLTVWGWNLVIWAELSQIELHHFFLYILLLT